MSTYQQGKKTLFLNQNNTIYQQKWLTKCSTDDYQVTCSTKTLVRPIYDIKDVAY